MKKCLFLSCRATTSTRKPKDEDSLSLTERSLDVQPQNRIPRSKQKLRGQGHKPNKGHLEVRDEDTSKLSTDYDTQSQSSMDVSIVIILVSKC